MNNLFHTLEQAYVLLPLLPVAILFWKRRSLSWMWTFWPLFSIGLIMSALVILIALQYLIGLLGDCMFGGIFGSMTATTCAIEFVTPLVRPIYLLGLGSILASGLFVLIGIVFLLELALRRKH